MSADPTNAPVPLAEISQGPNAFEQFLDKNQKNLVVLAVLLALGAAGYVVYNGIQKSAEETAGAALNKAEDVASLQAVVDQNAKTAAAGSAMVLLADKQWAAGQQDAAVATLQKFISSEPNHPAIPSAQASLGAKLMTQGKSAEATKVFQALADNSAASYIAPFALISIGDIAKAGGDLDKAEASYKLVNSKFPNSSFSETATRRLTILKAKAPVEIEAPPAPAKPADPVDAIKASLPPGVNVTTPPPSTPDEKPAPEKP